MLVDDRALGEAVAAWEEGDDARAEALCRGLLAQDPAHAGALRLMGDIALATGRPAAAVTLLTEALRHAPGDAGVFAGLGVALRWAGRAGAGERAVRAALAIDAQSLPALHAMARTAMARSGWSEAADWLGRYLALHPDGDQARAELAEVLIRQGRHDAAIPHLEQVAAAAGPDDWQALGNLGVALAGAGRFVQAVAVYRRAMERAADHPKLMSNLATALLLVDGSGESGREDEARALLHRAIAIAPDDLDNWFRLAQALRRVDRAGEAEDFCRAALGREPDLAQAHVLLALLLLQRGDLVAGFAEYEWRGRIPGFLTTDGGPAWDGGSVAGRTILLRAEQGLGDAIHFIRYALPLDRAGARVIVACERGLVRLFGAMPGVAVAVDQAQPLPPHDAQAPLMSLPHLLRLPDPLAAAVPYLRADPALADVWRGRIEAVGGAGLRVGLVWAGGSAFPGDVDRSLRFELLRPLIEAHPAIRFFGLQMGEGRREIEGIDLPANFVDLGGMIGDFADTAAIMAGLDLVISCDSSPAHLAGALGRPVWTLVPPHGDWRWGNSGEASAWYPTMRLHRRAPGEDWPAVMGRVSRALSALR